MTPQTYETHAHRPTAWNIVWLISLVAVALAAWTAVRDRTLVAHALLLATFGVLGTISLLRVFVLRVQDRVIRLEMRVRMTRLALEREYDELEHRQLIALRFASDGELPVLVRRAIAEKLPPDQIKRAITHWQGDYFRT